MNIIFSSLYKGVRSIKMYVFLFALLLYVVIAIVSILITYYVCVIFNKQSKAPEPALNAVISTNIVMLFNNIGDFVADTLSIITEKTFVLTDDAISKATLVSRGSCFDWNDSCITYTNG